MQRETNRISRNLSQKRCFIGLLAVALVSLVVVAQAQNTEKLSEEDLLTLLKFLDASTVVEKVEETGIGFSPDEETLKRLQEAGASEAMLDAVRKAGQKSQPGKAVSYQDVMALLKASVPEARILEHLQASPTKFVLDADQEKQLRDLGASDKLIDAIKGNRPSQGKNNKDSKISDLAVILDCSASMQEKTSDGVTKMNVAKQVVSDLVQRLPDGLHVTFVIYGHDKQSGCQGVTVIRELSPLNGSGKSELVGFIQQLQPASKTPIALSLRTAYEQLNQRDKESGLILISDGKETCEGDPQAEAAKLANNLNCSFGVNVVGFDVDEEGRTQLEEVAEAGSGEYYNAQNAADLSEKVLPKLEEKVEEAAIEPAIVSTKSVLTSITVKPLNLKGLPRIAEVGAYRPGDTPSGALVVHPVRSTKELGKPMVVANGKYDIWFEPDDGSKPVLLAAGLDVSQGESVELNPNRLVGAIAVPDPQLLGLDEIDWIGVYDPSKNPSGAVVVHPFQSAKRFGKPMLVTPGRKYDVWLKPKGAQPVPVAKGVKPKAGQITVIGQTDDGEGANEAGNDESNVFSGAEAGSD